MNIDGLAKHKNIGYAVIIVALVVGIFLFRPVIFPQSAGDPGATLLASRNPSIPTDQNSVVISCTAADINSGVLRYTFAGSDPILVTMTASGNIWSGTIPSKPTDTLVTYWVTLIPIAGGKEWSNDYTYTVIASESEEPIDYDATFIIYNKIDGNWEAASLGDTISGIIKIDLTVTRGASYVTRVSMRFLKQNDAGAWVEQAEVPMIGVVGVIEQYTITYDTTKLANAVYDIVCDFYTGDVRVYTESLFNLGDGMPDLGIDPDMLMLGLVGVVIIAIVVAFLKRRRRQVIEVRIR